MTTSEVSDDPFVEHLRRDPLPNAGIRIILLTRLPAESAERIISTPGGFGRCDREGGRAPRRHGGRRCSRPFAGTRTR